MKFLISIFFSIFVYNYHAQKKIDSTGIFPYQSGKIHIVDVIKDSLLSKDQLFNNAVIWFAKQTNSINNKIRNKVAFGIQNNIIIKNEQTGELVGTLKGIAHQSIGDILYSFDIYIYVKDGRYKYDLTNFKYLGNSLSNAVAGENMPMDINLESIDKNRPAKNRNAIKKINEDVASIINGLKASMSLHSESLNF